MDPHFQPHNNPAYPQTDPHYSPQVNSGPNKYPTLPPIQNPQHLQYNPNPSGPIVGYVPPALYGNIQEGPSQHDSREKADLTKEIEELDKNFKTEFWGYACWCYVVLLVNIPIALIALSMLMTDNQRTDRLLAGIFAAHALWLIIQSFFAISSYLKKNLSMANMACLMMQIFLIPCLSLEGLGIWGIYNFYAGPNGSSALGFAFFSAVSANLLIHITLSLMNALKVRRILAERAKIEMKLVEICSNNNA